MKRQLMLIFTFFFCIACGALSYCLVQEASRVAQRVKAEMITWVLRSAALGDTEAAIKLSNVYHQGNYMDVGIPQDIVAAYMWASIAAGHDDQASKRVLTELETHMTTAQLTAAKQLAAEWKPLNPNQLDLQRKK